MLLYLEFLKLKIKYILCLIFPELNACLQIPSLSMLVVIFLIHPKKIRFTLEGSLWKIEIKAPTSALCTGGGTQAGGDGGEG